MPGVVERLEFVQFIGGALPQPKTLERADWLDFYLWLKDGMYEANEP